MPTKTDLQRRVSQLETKVRADARLIESLRTENYDLRWQLGLNAPPQDDQDQPFEPNGLLGVPGYVQDLLVRMKAELKSKGRRHA